MANTKKYVSLDKLGLYDEKIKNVIADADAAALAAANKYADGLAVNYDAAGAAATAEANAKAYADGKDAAIAEAKKAGTDAAAAAGVADGKAVKAQGDVDALKGYVGTFTASEGVDTVVKYIDAKTANIASDETVSALDTRLTQAEKDIDAIEADYLKAADKTALEGKITAVETAVATEKSRAEGIEAGLESRLAAVEGDYLKDADKTELAEAIADEAERAAGVEEGLAARIKAVEDDYLVAADKEALQTQINTIMNNPDAEGAINSINEFTQYVKDHGTIADGFRTDIDKNKEDIAANAEAIADHEALAAETYATKTELAEAVEALQGVDTGLDNRLKAVESKFGEGDGNVAGMIATAKQEAIDAAASAADTKDEAILAAAKKYADDEDAKIESRVDALEGASATHALKSEVEAVAGRMTTAEGEIDTLQSEMDAVEALAAAADAAAKANAAAIALKASQADLEAVSGRVTTLETWHSNFVECSQEEINELFK